MMRIGPRCAVPILIAVLSHFGVAFRSAAAEAAATGLAVEAAAETDFERPAYHFLRQDEDWSALMDAPVAQGDDFFDPIKYVPLGEGGRVWASFGGSLRGRLESWFDFGFGTPSPDDDTFALGRLRLHGDLHVGRSVRAFVEVKSALSTDRDLPGGKRNTDVDDVALQQAFVDLRLPVADGSSLTLRLGRRGLQYGRQRLVSPLPWANTLRTWDGASLHFENDVGFVDCFWTLFAPVRKYRFNKPDEDQQFFGVYASGEPGPRGLVVDLYALGLARNGTFDRNGTIGDDDRYTLGGRIATPLGTPVFSLELEGAYQLGRVGGADVSAFMLALELAAEIADAWTAPRLALGLDYASGDHSAGGDVQTFDPLYPLGHAYFGIMDVIGRQNVVGANPSLTVHPLPGTTLQLSGHIFRRAQRNDALYNAGGMVVRPGAPGTSRDVGQEIDVVLRQQFGRHVTADLGYGHFFPGSFIEETGSDQAIDFFYLQLALRY
jgi:hypothetical protein